MTTDIGKDQIPVDEKEVVDIRGTRPRTVKPEEEIVDPKTASQPNLVDQLLDSIQGKPTVLYDTWHCDRLDIDFEFRSITSDEFEVIVKDNTKWLAIPNGVQRDLDGLNLTRALIILATTNPSWTDPKLIQRFQSARKALSSILILPGEINDYGDAILKLSRLSRDSISEIGQYAKVKKS